MEVENIELIDPAADLVQHDHVIRQSIPHRRIEAQGHIAATNKIGRRFGVAAGKESDVVPLAHQLLSQERNHPFRAPIKLGRHTFVKRSNLSNPQRRCHLTNKAWQANASVKVSVPHIELDDRSCMASASTRRSKAPVTAFIIV